ncbi:isochorismatase family protein [Microbaculum marinum]|uniref:Isochorismatase family protein n=1 Tax=Microbaculum marinum TaxID=1764581 RepID=A0AAW9RR47_9HYPH
MGRIWDRFLTERDQQVLTAAGYGTRAGFGKRPALLIVDVSYGFTGDRPEPILDSIKRWNNSCGEESWAAVEVIGRLADSFRARRLPVIYSTGVARDDNWDAGSWGWKNNRVDETVPPAKGARGTNEIVDEIAPQPQDIVVYKQKPSAFFGTNLTSYLNLLDCDSLIVTGCTTSGCVRATVIDAFSLNVRCTVVEDGCFDRCQSSHAVTLFDLHCKYADVLTGAEIEPYIEGLPDDLFENLPGR